MAAASSIECGHRRSAALSAYASSTRSIGRDNAAVLRETARHAPASAITDEALRTAAGAARGRTTVGCGARRQRFAPPQRLKGRPAISPSDPVQGRGDSGNEMGRTSVVVKQQRCSLTLAEGLPRAVIVGQLRLPRLVFTEHPAEAVRREGVAASLLLVQHAVVLEHRVQQHMDATRRAP